MVLADIQRENEQSFDFVNSLMLKIPMKSVPKMRKQLKFANFQGVRKEMDTLFVVFKTG